MSAYKTVILKITVIASVRQGRQKNNGYLVKAGYLLFFLLSRKAIAYLPAFLIGVHSERLCKCSKGGGVREDIDF